MSRKKILVENGALHAAKYRLRNIRLDMEVMQRTLDAADRARSEGRQPTEEEAKATRDVEEAIGRLWRAHSGDHSEEFLATMHLIGLVEVHSSEVFERDVMRWQVIQRDLASQGVLDWLDGKTVAQYAVDRIIQSYMYRFADRPLPDVSLLAAAVESWRARRGQWNAVVEVARDAELAPSTPESLKRQWFRWKKDRIFEYEQAFYSRLWVAWCNDRSVRLLDGDRLVTLPESELRDYLANRDIRSHPVT